MSSFRDSLNKHHKAQDAAGEPDVERAPDLVADAEDAQFDELPGDTAVHAPAGPASTAAASPGRQKLIGALVAIAVIAMMGMLLAGGGGDKEPSDNVHDVATSTSTVRKAKVRKPTVTPATSTTPTSTTPTSTTTEPGRSGTWSERTKGGRSGGPSLKDIGLPSAREKAAAKALLARAVKLITAWDHPADGRAGRLVNNSEKMAAALSAELGVPVLTDTGRMRPGSVYLKVERRVGLAIVYTVAGERAIPYFEQLRIHSTGIDTSR